MLRSDRWFVACRQVALALFVLPAGQVSAEVSPWYVAARVGPTASEAELGELRPRIIDDDAFGGAVAAGYSFNEYLAVELGAHDLGDHSGVGSPCRQGDDVCIERLATLGLCAEGFECELVLAELDASVSAFSLSLVPSWPLADRFSIFGKVGIQAWDASISAKSFGRIESFSGEDLLAGAGVRWDVSSRLGLVIEHERLDFDVSSTTFGLRWRL